jgi:hypothetical protein
MYGEAGLTYTRDEIERNERNPRKENAMNAIEFFTIYTVLRLVVPVAVLFLLGEMIHRKEAPRFRNA